MQHKHSSLEIENFDFSTQYFTSTCFFFPITFKNKTTHFVQPKNSYRVQTVKIPLHDLAIFAGWAQPCNLWRKGARVARPILLGGERVQRDLCPRTCADIDKAHSGSVGSRLLPEKLLAPCLVDEQTQQQNGF